MTRWNLATVAAGVVIVAVVSACGSNDVEQATVDPPSATVASVTIAPIDAGVGIVAEGCSLVAQLGSGAVIAASGQVVTVAHTVAGATAVTVVDRGGIEHAATVRVFDPDKDLAVLDVPTLAAPHLPLADGVVLGDGLFVVWNRTDGVAQSDVEVTRRLAITIEDIYVENTVERSGFEITGDVEIGDSGGVVVDVNGQAMGIVYANSRGRDGVGFAVDVTEISALLNATNDDALADNRCP